MAERVLFSVSLTIRSPFLFQGLNNAAFGVDASQLRDEQGRPIIPAEQVRGVLRAAMTELARHAPSVIAIREINGLFGGESAPHTPGDPDSFDRPNRGRLFFSDLTNESLSAGGFTTRVAIDDETGAAETGALQVIELAAPFGTDVTFEGTILLHGGDGLTRQRVEKALDRSLGLVPAIGALKSVGYGEVVDYRISGRNLVPTVAKAPAPFQHYDVVFDRPIIVDSTRETENLFVGAAIVPGATFKGALAAQLKLTGIDTETAGDWADALARLHVSHAFPLDAGGEPLGLPVPCSLLAWKNGEAHAFGDLLLSGAEGHVSATGKVGVHVVDWKDAVFESYGQNTGRWGAALAPVVRTHVAIDRETLVAEDAKLFTTVAKSHLRRADGQWTPRRWRLTVDFSDTPEARRAELSAALVSGLDAVGRTGARASLTPVDGPAPAAPPVEGHPSLHAMTLITPALLTDPASSESPARQYAAYIADATGGALVRSYTARRLAGGYVATRRRLYGQSYYPFVLTAPGSVFLIRDADPARLARVARRGLALTRMEGARTIDWRTCPYVVENGFGQVRFNLIDHAAMAVDDTLAG